MADYFIDWGRLSSVTGFPKLIFLDIDGVLNSHETIAGNGICTIDRTLMRRLNDILAATGAELVISSSWRYMILGGAMSLDGFRYLLSTHGLMSAARLHGHTIADEAVDDRGQQISEYLRVFAPDAIYIVLDDGSELPQPSGVSMSDALLRTHWSRWIKCDGTIGLDEACVQQAIALLNESVR